MSSTTWTDQYLESMRSHGDPLADDAIESIKKTGSIHEVNRFMTEMVGSTQASLKPLPEEVQRYLDESSKLPAWVNPDKIKIGERIFGSWGVWSCTILACASLPECYQMKHGIHVLATTQRLQLHARRRVLETAQMIMAVMLPGGLAPGGPGIRTAQKVRLMHAAIRCLIEHEHPPGPSASPDTLAPDDRQSRAETSSLADVLETERWSGKFGKPINQEDLAFTLMTFSHVALRSLDRLGVELTDEEKDAYVHCWNVVGYVMGVVEELLPADHVEAAELFARIKKRQGGPTEEAKAMQQALTGFLTDLMPGGPLKRLPLTVTRRLIGEDDADALDIPSPPWRDAVLLWFLMAILEVFSGRLNTIYGRHCTVQLAGMFLQDHMMLKIGELPKNWSRGLFNMPENLVARLPPDWKHSRAEVPSVFTEGMLSKL